MQSLASPLSFYGKLAADELGLLMRLPPAPMPLSGSEREQAAAHPGLRRALALLELGLRSEGVREWNYSLRGMTDRELLAAAQLACDQKSGIAASTPASAAVSRSTWPSASRRPLRAQVLSTAGEVGVDPAAVYGLIRQESRFVHDARSSVGASGLMQVMPATAKWLAKKNGLAFKSADLSDRDRNLLLGTHYLKMVLDNFDGSLPLAAAAYNAGPSRPRRWRDGPTLDAAIWAEDHPLQRDPRLREEGAVQHHHLCADPGPRQAHAA